MFDHYSQSQKRRRVANPALLAVATAVMVIFSASTIWAVLWLLEFLGFQTRIAPIEISYDPYEDGTTLEELTGGGAPPALLEPEAPADSASESPTPPK